MFTKVNKCGQELLHIDNLSSHNLSIFKSLEAWSKSHESWTAWMSSAWGSSSQSWKRVSWENNITLQILAEDVYNTLYVIS